MSKNPLRALASAERKRGLTSIFILPKYKALRAEMRTWLALCAIDRCVLNFSAFNKTVVREEYKIVRSDKAVSNFMHLSDPACRELCLHIKEGGMLTSVGEFWLEKAHKLVDGWDDEEEE